GFQRRFVEFLESIYLVNKTGETYQPNQSNTYREDYSPVLNAIQAAIRKPEHRNQQLINGTNTRIDARKQ
ncbi:unnamed protein product, partial [Medioppia subpectinata]